MIDVKEYQTLKRRVAELQSQHEQARGAYAQAMQGLTELGYASLEEAEAALADLRQQEATLEADYQHALGVFKQEFPNVL